MKRLQYLLPVVLLMICPRATQARPERLAAPVQEQLTAILGQVETDLKERVLPFWAKTWDEKYGGFNTVVDRYGKPKDEAGATDKRLIMQARMVWTLAAAHRYGIRDKGYLELASKGVRFITEKMWDTQHEGFHFSVKRDGTPRDSNKYTYAHTFVIYALSEYALASGDKDALRWAEKTFDLLERRARDGNLGYLEDFDREWRLLPLSIGMPNGRAGKTLNTHMHMMEALTSLADASTKPQHKAALSRVIQLLLEKSIDPRQGFAMEPFDYNWNPVADDKGLRSTFYGHNVELAWLMADAARAAGWPRRKVLKPVLGLIDHTMRFGSDDEYGGISTRGPYAGKVTQTLPYNQDMKKSWWEQAENLVATVEAFEWTGQQKYQTAFQKQWQWLWKHQIDHAAGDWFAETDWKTGLPITLDKGHYGWKAAYHNGRALMRVSKSLRRILDKNR